MNYSQVNWTKERRESMMCAQMGLCAICKKKAKLVMDHDHRTGCPRGLLCRSCNSFLGLAKDSTETLRNAILYIDTYKDKCGYLGCRSCFPEQGERKHNPDRLMAKIACALGMKKCRSIDEVSKSFGLPRAQTRKLLNQMIKNMTVIKIEDGSLVYIGN